MEKSKLIHIIDTTMIFISLIFFGYLTTKIIFDFFTDQYGRTSLGMLFVALIVFLFLLYVFVLHIKSFRICKLKNNWFLISFLLNTFVLLGLIIFYTIFSYYVRVTGGDFRLIVVVFFFIIMFGLIFFLSIILFLIGYYKNKK